MTDEPTRPPPGTPVPNEESAARQREAEAIARRVRLEVAAAEALQNLPRLERRQVFSMFLPAWVMTLLPLVLSWWSSTSPDRYVWVVWGMTASLLAGVMMLAFGLRRVIAAQRALGELLKVTRKAGTSGE